jgi:hypothetical protein
MTKVFGIGLSRTGSMSLTEALTILGFRALHFPADPVTQRERRLAGTGLVPRHGGTRDPVSAPQ